MRCCIYTQLPLGVASSQRGARLISRQRLPNSTGEVLTSLFLLLSQYRWKFSRLFSDPQQLSSPTHTHKHTHEQPATLNYLFSFNNIKYQISYELLN